MSASFAPLRLPQWATALALSVWLSAPSAALAQPSPSSLPKPTGCVLDRAGVLETSTVAAIQRECRRVSEQGHELAVVVMRSAGSRGPSQYALDLFNAWRLGGPDDNDGVLLYAAIDDRAAEITLGDDLDTPANTRRSDRIMSEVIVPAFRRGSPNDAMLNGARYAALNLFRAGPAPFARPSDRGQPASSAASNSASHGASSTVSEPARNSSSPEPSRSERPRSRYRYRPRPYQPPSLWERIGDFLDSKEGGITLGVLALLLLFGLRRYFRYRPRDCDECGSPMLRFDEVKDDEHLDSGQRKEEELGSVDYDVWACLSCDHVIEKRYAAILTRYRHCGSCGSRTQSSVTRTIRAATQHSTGLAEVTVSCAHCGKRSTHTRVIPKKPPPNRNRGGGGGGSSFRSSSSSRSYSSGGRSSGGGSSGRW